MVAPELMQTEITIAENDVPAKRILVLTPPFSATFQVARIFCCLLGIGLWLYRTYECITFAVQDTPPIHGWLAMIGYWCLWAAICIWYLRPLASPLRSEVVALDENEFRYDPGNLGSILFRMGPFMYLFVNLAYRGDWAGRSLVIPRGELTIGMIDDIWRSGARRLILYWKGHEFEIGACLTDDQRSAVHEEIKAWQGDAVESNRTS